MGMFDNAAVMNEVYAEIEAGNDSIAINNLDNVCIISLQEEVGSAARAEVATWTKSEKINYARSCGYSVTLTGQVL